jgi:hypothetical protein
MASNPELRFEVFGAKLNPECLPSGDHDTLTLKAQLGDIHDTIGEVACAPEVCMGQCL